MIPPTPETLMRSRYSAYATCSADYIVATTYPSRRSENLRREVIDFATKYEFQRLKILETREGQSADEALVGFEVTSEERKRYAVRGMEAIIKPQKSRELSRFQREDGRWYYVDSDMNY